MVRKILVVAFILFTGSLQSASAQGATQAAVNEAGRRADEAMKSNLSGLLGGLNLPPGLF